MSTCSPRRSMRSDKSAATERRNPAISSGMHIGGLLQRVQPGEAQQIANEAFHATRMAIDDFEELPPLRRFAGFLQQRLHVAAHGGEGRAQLVRHVRDEIAAYAIDAPQIADVVKDEHGAAAARRCGRGLRAENPGPPAAPAVSSVTSIGGRCSPLRASPSCRTTPGWRTAST